MEELRRADAELEENFTLTQEDRNRSRHLDREAKLDRLDNRGRKIAEYQAAYYEANKEKILDQQRQRRQRKREEKKNAASDGANIESSSPNIEHLHYTRKGVVSQ